MLAVLLRAAVAAPAPPATVNLNGQWSFQLYPNDEGLSLNWNHLPAFADQILVPGTSIAAAGFGNATVEKHHEYTATNVWASEYVEQHARRQ